MNHKFFLPGHTFLKSLKSKLLCTYFLLVVLPLGFFTVYTYLRVRSVVQEQTFIAMQNAFDDTVNSMQKSLEKLDVAIDILAMDSLVYAMASNNPKDYTYIRRLEDSDKLTITFEYLCKLSGIERIRLYVNNDYPYSSEQNSIVKLREALPSGWYNTLSGQSERMWFAPADFTDQPIQEQSCFSSMQVIYNPRNVIEPLAILRADMDASHIISAVEGTSVTENGILLLLKDKDILYHSANSTLPDTLYAIVDKLPEPDANEWLPIQADGKHYYAQCRSLSKSGWYMASVLPFNDIFRLSHELRLEMLIAVILISIIAYLLAVAISRSTLNRIALLTQTMQAVQEGNVDVRPEPSGDDEVAQLMGNFNKMMDRIDELMEEKVVYGQQIKSLELKALQAQINPHFLYNSLDLINCTAISHSVPQISRMVKALGQFYRISLSGGNEQIPLSAEIKHAKLYVDIQNMRFEDRIQAHWSLDEEAKNCLIIKIILQPLIENAIIHGIFEKPSKTGNLWVSAMQSDNMITITVSDDGVGMDGSIPPWAIETLLTIGEWMNENNESIYGCTKSPLPVSAFGCRVTAKGNVLYLHIMQQPVGPLPLSGIRPEDIRYARMLSTGAKVEILTQGWAAQNYPDYTFLSIATKPNETQLLPDSSDTVVKIVLR